MCWCCVIGVIVVVIRYGMHVIVVLCRTSQVAPLVAYVFFFLGGLPGVLSALGRVRNNGTRCTRQAMVVMVVSVITARGFGEGEPSSRVVDVVDVIETEGDKGGMITTRERTSSSLFVETTQNWDE